MSQFIKNLMTISDEAEISSSAQIGNFVTIYPKVKVSDKCVIFDGAVIGRQPLSNAATNRSIISEYKNLFIGAGTIIGANAVLYTNNKIGEGVLIGDLAIIREQCEIGASSIIGQNVCISYNVKIGARTRVQNQSHISGNSIIENDVFIAMGVMTSNDNDMYQTRFKLAETNLKGVIIRRFATVGIGACILPGIEIGEGAMVAAGSLVTKNVPAWTIVAGLPAKHFKDIPAEVRKKIESLKIHEY